MLYVLVFFIPGILLQNDYLEFERENKNLPNSELLKYKF